ncbi:MAG: AAA family ATPase [Clostridiaceae bacterium]|nr:AAA family ATPase [Clostridiaceae bacterium]
MCNIHVKLFNTPIIVKNEETIHLPFRKAEALFYYLIVNKQATREELVNLLWGEIEEEIAKKNLRNAMYKIRKAFDLDIIISPQKSIVMLNPDIKITSDFKIFLENEGNSIEAYTGEFLQGFFVKDGEAFEDWIFNTRELYKDLYISNLYNRMSQSMEKRDYNTAEQYAKLVIQADAFDERAYRRLMEIYNKQKVYNKAIDIYNRLYETLQQELGITPDATTRALFQEILDNRDKKSNKEEAEKEGLEDFFYGRTKEIEMLSENYENFMMGKSFSSLLITGEAGIGKTRLKEQFLEGLNEKEVYLFHTNCYQAEEEYFLKPWNAVFSTVVHILHKEKIEMPMMWKNILASIFPIFAKENTTLQVNFMEEFNQFKFRVVEEAVMGLFKKISEKKKIIIVFEDLQWIDVMSLSLLSSILLDNVNSNILFLGTCREGFIHKIDNFITKTKKYHVIEEIYIPRFTTLEVVDFMEKALPEIEINQRILEEIYKETEGNTFFIMEYLNCIKEKKDLRKITTKMQDILKSRFLDISEEGKKLLNIISLFFDKASLDMLKVLINKDELELMHIVEELQNKNIIQEIEEEEKISFQFTHLKLREFIYLQQSTAMRKVLHNKVASILENQLKHDKVDVLQYSNLIYHFSSAGNKIKTLKYSIKNINSYLEFCHELFPVLNEFTIEKEKEFHVGKKELKKYLVDIEEQLKVIKRQHFSSKEIYKLEIEFLHIKGRHLIGEGDYDQGLLCIEEMMEKSQQMEVYEYTLKGYRQMIYYCIQIHSIEKMQDYVEEGLRLARKHNYKKELGILLRLKGLNRMMVGEYVEAEEMLEQSIKIFNEISKFEDKYLLNIAAAYNYMGEIRRYNMKFSIALNYYDKAMAICENKKVIKGLALFNTNAGQAALDMGDYQRAKNYFDKAIYYYQQTEVLWGRSIAEGYMALLLVREGQYKEALQYLQRAETYSNKLKSPYEMALLCRVKVEIKAIMRKNKALNRVFQKHLDLSLEQYCKQGIQLLNEVKDSYEKEILKVFIKEDNNIVEE